MPNNFPVFIITISRNVWVTQQFWHIHSILPVDSIKSICFVISKILQPVRKVYQVCNMSFTFIYNFCSKQFSDFMWFLCEIHAEAHFGSILYHCQILTKIELCWHVLVKLPNTKIHENPFSGAQFSTCRWIDREHSEANTGVSVSSHCKHAKKNNYCGACNFFMLVSYINMCTKLEDLNVFEDYKYSL
jgi:hypothetical protein